uniref:Putative conserved secreted protein n=1 Tax=Panstrongylus lignarius TaxID=156445 RepID=A0A224XNA1_9HEMI
MEVIKVGIIAQALLLFLQTSLGNEQTTSSREQVIFIYPSKLNQEDELEQCTKNSVCGIYHKRKWFTNKVQQLCKCPNTDCPSSWNEGDVHLDNNSQLKICINTSDLNICREHEIGLRLTEEKEKRKQSDLKLDCNCQWPSYWQLTSHKANTTFSYNEYSCTKWKRCERGEFCGHVRDDIHSLYIQCSCPKDHICVSTDRTLRNASEAFYSGPMLRAYCTPLSKPTTTEPSA